jgi:hypothetical protein
MKQGGGVVGRRLGYGDGEAAQLYRQRALLMGALRWYKRHLPIGEDSYGKLLCNLEAFIDRLMQRI